MGSAIRGRKYFFSSPAGYGLGNRRTIVQIDFRITFPKGHEINPICSAQPTSEMTEADLCQHLHKEIEP